MKIGIIKERIYPPDRRVVFTPEKLVELKQQYPNIEIKIEPSEVRIYPDIEYQNKGFRVTADLSDCDILFGVKEVPVEFLIPNKKYFFFSHTIKKQAHNRELLQQIIRKNIELYDYETLVDSNNQRLIGFGRYAGLVGAYNAFRLFGLKYELFKLVKAENLQDKEALFKRLKTQFLPPIKIAVTGSGRVGGGIIELLTAIKIKKVTPSDFLTKKYSSPVYTQLTSVDYFTKKSTGGFDKADFYAHPSEYESTFNQFSEVADILITGHFQAKDAPILLSKEMLRSSKCNLKVVADVSCDIDGSIACSIRTSSIADPFYGYLPREHSETDYFNPSAVSVMAVSNLPCELSKDASEGFGEMFTERVFPSFFNGDKDQILNKAKVTFAGKLTDRYSYLEDFVNGKN